MRKIVVAALSALLGLSGVASAQSQPAVVVELYTSQGCSACPPADELFADLTQHADVIPLALHVDYWDYIGWTDHFAQPQFTQRQKAYARAAGSKMIYTPQMIIGGLDRVEGHRPMEIAELIQQQLAAGTPVQLMVTREGARVLIEAEMKQGVRLPNPVGVQLVRYRPSETVEIQRGENAGRTVTYHNIVTSWRALGEWSGSTPLRMEAEAAGADPVVVILQDKGPARIFAAAQVK